jgi:hypothetical protein
MFKSAAVYTWLYEIKWRFDALKIAGRVDTNLVSAMAITFLKHHKTF